MKRYIDKADVLAEIEKLKRENGKERGKKIWIFTEKMPKFWLCPCKCKPRQDDGRPSNITEVICNYETVYKYRTKQKAD